MSKQFHSWSRGTAWRILPFLAVLALAVATLAACGGGDASNGQLFKDPSGTPAPAQTAAVTQAPSPIPSTPSPAPTAAPATPAPATPAPTQAGPVTVNVTLAEFKVTSSLTTFQVGVPYHIIVTNNGIIPHQAVLGSGPTLLVNPHTTQAVDVTFTKAGSEEFACHLPAHYEAGMHLSVTML